MSRRATTNSRAENQILFLVNPKEESVLIVEHSVGRKKAFKQADAANCVSALQSLFNSRSAVSRQQ